MQTKGGTSMRIPGILLLMVLIFLLLSPIGIANAQEMSGGEAMPSKDSVSSSASSGETVVGGGAEQGQSGLDLSDLSPTTLGMIVVAMLIGGLVLLFIEVALIPGFGLTGITGIIVIFAGMGLAFWKLDIKLAVPYTLISFVAVVGLVLWSVYIFPYTTLGKKFRLETRISVEDGYTAIRDMSKYVGMEGVATSDLRPSGIARVGDDRLDVISDGEFVPRGTKIKIIKEKGGSLIAIPLDRPTS
ncbi:hypothetical protein AUK22_06240 [bacterium CG2_30_54_10]|nr:MAG: hypothetical protein AUK22_06240 [bacterium CG2_30_54_10]